MAFDITSNQKTLIPLGSGRQSFIPKVDVKEDKDQVIAIAELPGIDNKDIELIVTNDMLTLRGEKKSETEEREKNFYRIERSYGSFERRLSFPCDVQSEKAEAVFKNGILTVTIPKTESAKKVEKKLIIKIT